MNIKEFRQFCTNYFKQNGFEKIKSKYYRKNNSILCELEIIRSAYGNYYYIEYTFYLGTFEKPYEVDIQTLQVWARFQFTSKEPTFKEQLRTEYYYEKYNEEELKNELDREFAKKINPPFSDGIEYIVNNYNIFYTTFSPAHEQQILNSLS